jgi:hypothetical protein
MECGECFYSPDRRMETSVLLLALALVGLAAAQLSGGGCGFTRTSVVYEVGVTPWCAGASRSSSSRKTHPAVPVCLFTCAAASGGLADESRLALRAKVPLQCAPVPWRCRDGEVSAC